jgi:hypothetical protein
MKKKILELGKIFILFFKSQMSPLYLLTIVFPTLDLLTATVMAFISQNVKLYLAYTEYRVSQK